MRYWLIEGKSLEWHEGISIAIVAAESRGWAKFLFEQKYNAACMRSEEVVEDDLGLYNCRVYLPGEIV